MRTYLSWNASARLFFFIKFRYARDIGAREQREVNRGEAAVPVADGCDAQLAKQPLESAPKCGPALLSHTRATLALGSTFDSCPFLSLASHALPTLPSLLSAAAVRVHPRLLAPAVARAPCKEPKRTSCTRPPSQRLLRKQEAYADSSYWARMLRT